MSYDLIFRSFQKKFENCCIDPTISDLMINGTSGVYADRAGMVEHVKLSKAYTNETSDSCD